jgi:serine/threonine-protein phosphatase 6 regulatory subunit 3
LNRKSLIESFQIVVECSVANKLIDCWNANALSQQQQPGGRRLGYMGHLIDIFSAINSTISASDEFRALIESSLTPAANGSGEPAATTSDDSNVIIDKWNQILQTCEDELTVQNRLLADCDPNDRHDYGRDGLTGFPSIPDESENDTEDYSYHYNPSMQ